VFACARESRKRLRVQGRYRARTSICALFRGAKLASFFKMNPGEGFLIPAGFIPVPVACFFAGGCEGRREKRLGTPLGE